MVILFQCRLPLAALIFALLLPLNAAAQDAVADPLALDPETPLADLPDIGIAWPELKSEPIDPSQPAAQTEIAEERRYKVSIEGMDGVSADQLAARFDALSVLKANEGKPANIAQIDRRAREDADVLVQLLRADGYYDSVVETRVEPGTATTPLTVFLTIEPGPLYRFSDVAVTGLGEAGPKGVELRNAFTVDVRDPVDADDVIASESTLTTLLSREGFPFAKIGESEVVVDHDTRTATLSLTVDPGGERRFDQIIVKGERPPFGKDHIARIARFKPGQLYNQAGVDDLRRAIIATGLVSGVKIETVPGSTPQTVDMAVTMDPAPLHTIAAEAGYGTGEGVRLEASWTHRNLIKPEGAVTLRGVIGTREQLLGAVLRQANFRKRDQVLNGRIAATNINRSAYDARTFEIAGNIERQTNIIWQKKWTWSAGFELLASQERDVAASGVMASTYFIGALPATLHYDGSNDLLDPTRGFRLGLRLSPEASLQSGAFGYARAQIDGSAYVPARKNLVIAGRVRLGTIAGAARDRIAPSRRYYAGGGGSVRGYGFQEIGPRDTFNDPVGGRSLAEFSLEARIRFGAFGVVPFIDGGNISTSAMPSLSGLRYGAGVGARYHSSFGPIRIDVGTPINPQPGDARVAVYVSLGQAF